ncbi:MAG: glycosyl hydrolase family 28-related protein, partial [Candidatus Acidiferrales bacterium]
RVDVTAYGAKGDGVTDDTAAIQSAITAVCGSYGHNIGGGTIFFPPGVYLVSQPQLPSTAAVFPLPCGGLHFQGGNGTNNAMGGAQFNRAPQTRILVSLGASPNAAAVFSITSPSIENTFENLTIDGHNQALSIFASVDNTLKNVCLAVQTSGQTDNTALKITNSFWFFMDGGCLQTLSMTIPVAMFTGETPIAGENPLVGLVYFTNIQGSGGGMQYIQRVNTTGSGPGNFIFRNVAALENTNTSFLTVTNTTGNPGNVALPMFANVTFDNVSTSDGTVYSPALLEFNSANSGLQGVFIFNSLAGNGGQGPAIRMDAGYVIGCHVIGASHFASSWVVDSNGNPTGNCATQNNAGYDYITDITNQDRLRSDLFTIGDSNGTPFRAVASGNRFATVAIDPGLGYLFGTGSSFGYGASLFENAAGSIDVQFANIYPPTAVTGTATTGGTLAAGTYYAAVTTTSDNCTHQSAISTQSAAISVGGSNNAINVSWTLPVAGMTPANGYCVSLSTTPNLNPAKYWQPQIVNAVLAPGGSTTSALVTTVPTAYGVLQVTSTMAAAHRFTSNALGINQLNPQYSLDVNGTAAVNSLNGVQKAERFAGADAGVQLNACLTAAATTSSVCDARGLTGTLTGTHHITIPAGTTLEWGRAQLVISDSTTNDAIELTGDGASVVGYQESGLGTVAAPDTSGYIGCGIAGCTVIRNPNQATAKINFVHIFGMYLQANGSNSKVIDMTSIGHSDIENNNLQLGTGGNSYGVYGSSSVGGFDGSNTLFKHNNFQPESSGDTCFSLAGTYNAVVLEQNACVLPPAASTGYTFSKDTSGNYPNNDEIYGNDCETSSQAFNQVCYNIVGVTSITFGPNNRCENVYNCYQFPSDGSSDGIHVLDPYLSITNNTQIKPNEPATSMVAIDNNGHNWTPSMHYGMNDLAGDNLLGNGGFEGWQNSTTMYYWGGVAAGGTINQPGSGIYLQNASSSSTPAVDSYTQGSYNLRVGDGATAGLGVNSGCIQVDATKEYTLMFRVASGSTSNNFRPGIRFYYDSNCTSADVISSVATNARVLSPANYAGTSSATGNYQSTNASLTYNNGITCGCNVTGADWQVATANTWTPTRNYGLIFRVPNGYSSNTTIAHSMRIFLLENTAATGNYVYFDDIVLSQGPVTPDMRLAPLRDSANPQVYGSLGVSQHLNQGAANTFAGTVALASGTATVTFPTGYNSAPVCVANDTSAIATVRVQTTATTLTLSQSSGTDTIMYMCVGNPN